MSDRVVGGGDDVRNQMQKLKVPSLDGVFALDPSKSLLGSSAMVSFGVNKSRNSFFRLFDQEESGDEPFDEYFTQPEKKRRLSIDHVQVLERSFKAENKLEPERKIQMAKELGVQPRQIAVWFQNRRARCKTKQIETDYDALHVKYNSLKNDYEKLLKENEKIKDEVLRLKDNILARDMEKENSILCDSKELNEVLPNNPITNTVSEDELSYVSAVASKNEDQSLVKIDSIDILESRDSSSTFDHDQLGFFPNEKDNLNEELTNPVYIFSKTEDDNYHPSANYCTFGFPAEDHGLSFWSY